MKYLIHCLIFFLFVNPQIQAQDSSWINIGYGITNIFKNYDSWSGGYHNLTKESKLLFIEIPVNFNITNTMGISLRPGFAYTEFHEHESGGGLGGGSSKTLLHTARSLYGKLLFTINPEFSNNLNFYCGPQFGKYLQSKTVGSQSSWAMQEYGTWRSSSEINKNGNDFFYSDYFGIVLGIQPLFKKIPVINLSFEMTYFPKYVVLYDTFKIEERENLTRRSSYIASLIIGFNPKKGTHK